MHEAPANAESQKKSDHIRSIVCSFIMHYKNLFLWLESITIKLHDSNFIIALRLQWKSFLINNFKKRLQMIC